VISGETKELVSKIGLTKSDIAQGWSLGCRRTAVSDVLIEVKNLGEVVIPPAKTQPCRISSLKKLSPDVIKAVLRLPPAVAFEFIPGQCIDVIGPGGVHRSCSLANAPKTDNMLELHIRALENGSMRYYWFNQAAVNDLLRLHGPQGTFFMRKLARRELIFLATGTGFAPIKAMLEALPSLSAEQMPQSVTVLWGASHSHDLYFDVSALPGNHRHIPVLSRSAIWEG
jgi:CDP-4-dehydro-6-deoxyglucose reductase